MDIVLSEKEEVRIKTRDNIFEVIVAGTDCIIIRSMYEGKIVTTEDHERVKVFHIHADKE